MNPYEIYNLNKLRLVNLNPEKCPEYIRDQKLKTINDDIVNPGKEEFIYSFIKRPFFERKVYTESEIRDYVLPLHEDSDLKNPLNNWIVDSNLFFLKPYLYKYLTSSQSTSVLMPGYNNFNKESIGLFDFNNKMIFPEFCLRSTSPYLLGVDGWSHCGSDTILYLRLTFQFAWSFLQFLNYFKLRMCYETQFETSFKFYEKYPHLAENINRSITADERNVHIIQIMDNITKIGNVKLFKKRMSKPRIEEAEKLLNDTKITYQKIFESSDQFTNFLIKYNMDRSLASPSSLELIQNVINNS